MLCQGREGKRLAILGFDLSPFVNSQSVGREPGKQAVCVACTTFITAQVRTHDDELHSLGTILVCVFCIFAWKASTFTLAQRAWIFSHTLNYVRRSLYIPTLVPVSLRARPPR